MKISRAIDFVLQLVLHLGRDGAARAGHLLGQCVDARLGHGLAVDDGHVLGKCGSHGTQQGSRQGGGRSAFSWNFQGCKKVCVGRSGFQPA
jgi:hypothetical protein